MHEHSKFRPLVIVIIDAKAKRTDRRVHYKPGHTGEIDFGNLGVQQWLLVFSFYDSFQRFEQISFQPEIEILSQRENISPSTGDEVECTEVLKDHRPRVLHRIEARRIEDGTLVVGEQRLIGEN